jgi:hypothetical protein
MEYSTIERWEGISETGIIYDQGSLYARFEHLSDPRKARGIRYSLVTLLVIIFLGKLCGQDHPVEIADWARNHAGPSPMKSGYAFQKISQVKGVIISVISGGIRK